jgi:hypothetical protein
MSLPRLRGGHTRTLKVPAYTFVLSSVVLPTLPLLQIAGAAPSSKTLPLSTRAEPSLTPPPANTPERRSSVVEPPATAPDPYAADQPERAVARSTLNAKIEPGDLWSPVWSTFSVSGVTPAALSYMIINDSDQHQHMTVTFASFTPPVSFLLTSPYFLPFTPTKMQLLGGKER